MGRVVMSWTTHLAIYNCWIHSCLGALRMNTISLLIGLFGALEFHRKHIEISQKSIYFHRKTQYLRKKIQHSKQALLKTIKLYHGFYYENAPTMLRYKESFITRIMDEKTIHGFSFVASQSLVALAPPRSQTHTHIKSFRSEWIQAQFFSKRFSKILDS